MKADTLPREAGGAVSHTRMGPSQLCLQSGRPDNNRRLVSTLSIRGEGKEVGRGLGGREGGTSKVVGLSVAGPVFTQEERELKPITVRRHPTRGQAAARSGNPKVIPEIGVLPLGGPEPPLEPANTTGHILGIRDDEEGPGACGRRHDRSEKLSTLDRLGTRGEQTQGPGPQTKVNAASGPGEAT